MITHIEVVQDTQSLNGYRGYFRAETVDKDGARAQFYAQGYYSDGRGPDGIRLVRSDLMAVRAAVVHQAHHLARLLNVIVKEGPIRQ